MSRNADRYGGKLRDWMLHGVLDRRVSLGATALMFLLAVCGMWNSGPVLITVSAAVCLVASVIGFIAVVTKGEKNGTAPTSR